MSDLEDFWIVWSPDTTCTPTVKHETKEAAEKEAERLATMHRGKRYYVLEGVSLSVAPPINVKTTRLGIPF